MDSSFPDKLPCISAPTSARISRSQEEMMCFYSVPTSPGRTYEDANSNLDEFEFETSRRFNPETDTREEEEEEEEDEKQKQRPQMPTMAFADEIFRDGKVLPLGPPLKLPPRLQNERGKNTSSTASLSSPGSLRIPFLGQSLWNDDFDPFKVALEVVKEEKKREKSKGRYGVRMTKSLSPFRDKSQNSPNDSHYGPPQLVCDVPKEPLMPSPRSPKMLLCEPKGVVFARRVRLGVDKDGTIEPNRSKEECKSDGAWIRKKKREKIMRFVFGKANNQHKLKDQKAELEKFGSLSNETVSEAKKMTVTCHKPRLLLCLGYGGRYVK